MDALFQNVLTASFHGSIVILAVILLRMLLKKTPKKFLCFLWLLAGLRLLMPFEIQSAFSLQPEEPSVIQEQRWIMPGRPVFEEVPETNLSQPTPQQQPVVNEILPETMPQPQAEETYLPAEQEPFIDWQALVPYFWLAVAGCFAIYTIYCYLRLSYQVREAIKIPGGYECEHIETAFILGFIKPKIYIPMGLPSSVRRHILAHERTHLEKGDHWFKMIGFLALALHWFNPLVWVAYILLCKDIEMACDERVVQFMNLEERKSYSAALLSCSTNHAHFAACPVAFGEVSVKDRIKSVLHYRKPSFWISLAGVAAILFVALCLLTNPLETPPAAPGTSPEQIEETVETIAPAQTVDFTSTLTTQEEVKAAVEKGIRELMNRDIYDVEFISIQKSEEWETAMSHTVHYYKQGENLLALMVNSETGSYGNSFMLANGNWYDHYGDYWVDQGSMAERNPDYTANTWLKQYLLEDYLVVFPDGLGVVDGKTVSFQVQWEDRYEGTCVGTYTVTFFQDGTIDSLNRDYTFEEDYGDRMAKRSHTESLTVKEIRQEHISAIFQAQLGEVYTEEELEQLRREEQTVSEIPSNKTDYDKDFMLGSGQMGWQFMNGDWFFKFGADNVSNTGLTLVLECNDRYGEESTLNGTMESGDTYWLEQFVGGEWVMVDLGGKTVTPIARKTFRQCRYPDLTQSDNQTISWKDSYGELPGGMYRIGNYYTFTSTDGQTDTQVCYAKFRLYDANQEAILSKAKNAMDKLKNADSYHLYSFDWMIEHDYEYYLSKEIWKSGEDYLSVTRYPSRADLSVMTNVRTELWRNSESYGLSWEGEPLVSAVSQWRRNRPGYMDGGNLDMWALGLEWYDAKVEVAYQEGNEIHIIETYDFDDKYTCTDLILTLDNSGNLKGIRKAYLPDRNCAEKDKVISEELTVFDTTGAEVRKIIDSVDVSQPMPFSYAEDVAANPNAQKTGFKNMTPKTVKTPADALALAHEECTLPQLMEFEKGYCQSETYYDEASGMWKVHLFWWQHDSAQTIYLDSQGITQMIVTVK